MKISKSKLRQIIKEELMALHEDADDDRDFEIEEAIRDGDADGASGAERTPPHSFASRYYNDAYDRAAKKSK